MVERTKFLNFATVKKKKANCCENSNEFSGSIKGVEFHDQLNDNHLLKKDALSYYVIYEGRL
jgi:hypothetical protein